MAIASIFSMLLITVIARCTCDHNNRVTSNNGHSDYRFGDLLKPPPPPLLSQIVPVPFHGGRNQQQNLDVGYGYQPPPPPPLSATPEFKFPAPFYEQYNFNFLRSPQPFTTTPSPSLFQKVSTWLFPSEQTSYDVGSTVNNNNNISPVKKDCNPCNLVPWIPVIRYNNIGAKKFQQNIVPTYGPPSPTAFVQNVLPYQPHLFHVENEEKNVPQLGPSIPQVTYSYPTQSNRLNSDSLVSSTYGPPSPTHIIETNVPNSSGPIISVPSNSYIVPSISINSQSTLENQPSSLYFPTNSQREVKPSYVVTSTYKPSTFLYATPSPTQNPSSLYKSPYVVTKSFEPVSHPFASEILSKNIPTESDVEILKNDNHLEELRLPKVTHSTRFSDSYGEPITTRNVFDVPYSMSGIVAESTNIHTEVLPDDTIKRPNISLALANPAPFTLNRGRNIHTLQPVALPNLSVSPLPPIFNARPFRPIISAFPTIVTQRTNDIQSLSNNVNIEQSVPLVEFTHSVDYPATFIQSPVIDIDISKGANQTKGYRDIPNSFIIDEVRDITSQASEDHISATKSVSDSSFESTGSDVGNDFYDTGIPTDLKQSYNIHTNHQVTFADLRGVKDKDVDKYRTESNLQNIDSPLLYLKPSIPHKKHRNFIENVPVSPVVNNEYEIYDEIPVTTQLPSPSHSSWDDSRIDYSENVNPPLVKEVEYKPKIVQIIVPYITGKKATDSSNDFTRVSQSFMDTSGQEFNARKVPFNTENLQISTENYSTQATTKEEPISTITENYDLDQYSPGSNNFYDVRDPPFDIVKLQHTIDNWTEQEYSNEYKTLERTRNSEKYSKQIPDEYFTTTIPTNYETETNNYNYDLFDHESASSIQYSVAENSNNTFSIPRKEYNTIERTKIKPNTDISNILNDAHKLHIYTAASSFRTSSTTTTSTTTTTTTTPAPWGKIQTSISPLTKEKVYVVTSKPWRETRNLTNEWYAKETLKSNKSYPEKDTTKSDGLPFQSPRFINRPSFGFTSGGKVESVKSDSLYGFSRSWYQSINNLENQGQNNTLFLSENFQQEIATNLHKDSTITTTAKPHRIRNL